MFRFLVNLGTPMNDLSELHPVILDALLERCWNAQLVVPNAVLGHPDHRTDVPARPGPLLDLVLNVPPVRRSLSAPGTIDVKAISDAITAQHDRGPGLRWHHLVYAYMIENTRVVEVFRRVVEAFLHGERLGALAPDSQRWLWTTEELFLRDPPSFSVGTQTSSLRPRLADTRMNAYQRAFGMTLNAPEGRKPEFPQAEHANGDFVPVMDEFLHELWQGRSNFKNQVGARPTDDAKIAALAKRLCDMLRARRANGTLSREEFSAVAMMEWFHATLETPNHPILRDLRIDAPSPEERLFKAAQAVGASAHGLAKNYFEIAEPISRLLIAIEQETYNTPAAVPALYTPAGAGSPAEDTDVILTHWSIIRGKDVKAQKAAAA